MGEKLCKTFCFGRTVLNKHDTIATQSPRYLPVPHLCEVNTMNRLAKIFSRATSKNAAEQSSHTLFVECLEERQMLSTVDIIAAGATGEETVELIIEGETVAVFENVGGNGFTDLDFVTLSYSTDEVIDPSAIEVAFTNDLFDPENGIDRNVRVDYVLVDLESDGTVNENSDSSNNTIFRFEAEDSSVFSTGTFRSEDGISSGFGRGDVLHGNGSFVFDGSTDGQGNLVGATDGAAGSVIKMNVRGDTGDEKFNLLIDGEVVQTYDATTELSEFRFVANEVVSVDQIRVEFINDFYDPANGIDRNLIVSSVRVNDQLFQTEAPSTFSTGVFRAGEGIVSGFNETEILSTNGFFQYASSGARSFQFAGESFDTTSDSSQVFVQDGILTVRGTNSSVASASFTQEINGGDTYTLSFDAYRDIISGSIGLFTGQPFGSIGINFNDADGNVVSQRLVNNLARNSRNDGFRTNDFLAPDDAVSASVFVFAGLTDPGVEIPVRVRDIELTLTDLTDVTPPDVELVRASPLFNPAPTLDFSLRVTDESGLGFFNGPNPGPEITVFGPEGFTPVDLNSIAASPIDGGVEFFFELPAPSGGQFTEADNGPYFARINQGAFADSLGNEVEEDLSRAILVLIGVGLG